jgi:hypothetical protein
MIKVRHGRAFSLNGSLAEAARVARALVVFACVAALVVALRFALYDCFHGGRTLAALQEMTHS